MKQCLDHKGNSYPSVKEMCNTYGISYDIYNGRRTRGWTLEAALTTPEGESKKKKPATFEIEGTKPSVEYKRYLEYKLRTLNGMSSPQLWQDQIDELLRSLREVETMSNWLKPLDNYLSGKQIPSMKKDQIEQMLNHPVGIIGSVVDFDRDYHVSGYFEPLISAN